MFYLESELRPVSGGEASEDGAGDVEEGEVEAEVGAGVHRHRAVEPAEEGGRLGVHQDDFHLRQNTERIMKNTVQIVTRCMVYKERHGNLI